MSRHKLAGASNYMLCSEFPTLILFSPLSPSFSLPPSLLSLSLALGLHSQACSCHMPPDITSNLPEVLGHRGHRCGSRTSLVLPRSQGPSW